MAAEMSTRMIGPRGLKRRVVFRKLRKRLTPGVIAKRKLRKDYVPLLWQARVIAHSPGFRLLARRSSLLLARSRFEAEDQAWVDSLSWWNSEEAAELARREGDEPWWRTENEKK
jgi:hypothetical protein